MRAWSFIVVFALLVLTPRHAAARCDREASRLLFREGMGFFEVGRYDEAIERWQRAYTECDNPALVFNLAQAHRRAGHVQAAIDAYRTWLELRPDASAEEVADVEQKLASLEKQLPVPTPPVQEPPAAPAVVAAPAVALQVDDPVPEPVRMPPAPPHRRAWQRPSGWTALAVGALAAGAATWSFALLPGDREAALAADSQQEIDDHNHALRSHERNGWIFTGVAGVALGAGAFLLLWPDESPGPGLELSSNRALASWSWSF